MRTLNDIEIEDILAGKAELPVDADNASRQRLAAASALQSRMRNAHATTAAPPALAAAIRASLAEDHTNHGAPAPTLRFPTALKRILPAAAVAAMLAIAIGVWVLGSGTEQAYAQPELAAIHESNVEHGNQFQPCRDGSNIRRRMREHAGRNVNVPALPGGCHYAGSTLAKFREGTVAAAIVDSKAGPVSIITLKDPADSLGFSHRQQRSGRTIYTCGYDRCRMAAVSIDGLTFVATGEVSHEQLIALLHAFATANASSATD
jgi:hypothetical protein